MLNFQFQINLKIIKNAKLKQLITHFTISGTQFHNSSHLAYQFHFGFASKSFTILTKIYLNVNFILFLFFYYRERDRYRCFVLLSLLSL